MAHPPHPDTCRISFTYTPVTSTWVTALHSLFLDSDPPPPCHPPSKWLRLFSSQTFSHINTLTFSIPVILHTYPPMKMEQTECSKMLAYKIQTLRNYPEESIQHSEHSKSLKSRIKYVHFYNAFRHLVSNASLILVLLLLSIGLPVANAPDILQPCGLLYYP
jgi:hypothetical protein